MAEGFSQEQLEQLESIVEKAVQRGFQDAGLRIDGPEHQYEATADLRWVRQSRTNDEFAENQRFTTGLRKALNGWAAKIGWMVIAAGVGGLLWLFNLGLQAWRGGP